MKKLATYLKVILLLALVAFLYGFAQLKDKQRKISEIQVRFIETHPKFISVNKVENLLKSAHPTLLTVPKSKLDLNALELAIKKDEMVEQAEVFIQPKGTLTVKIIQRVPVLRLTYADKTFYIDRKGKDMPLSPNFSARVPLVTGVSSEKSKKEVFELVQLLQSDAFYKKQIIGIHRKMNGDYLLSTRIGRQKVLLGKMKNVADKLKRLQVFYKKEWGTATLNKYTLINLKYNRQVVCSK